MLHFCSEETSASVNPTKGIKKGKENKSATNVGWIPLVTGGLKSKHGIKTLSSHNLSFLLSDDSLEGFFWGGGGILNIYFYSIICKSEKSLIPQPLAKKWEPVLWVGGFLPETLAAPQFTLQSAASSSPSMQT